jgi:PAS domain S-box-containing protein
MPMPMDESGAVGMPEIGSQLFQSFCDAMPLGVCLVDLQGKIVYWNAAAESITGYLSHEVLGRAYRGDLLIQCSHCEGVKRNTELQCPVREVLRDGSAVVAELFLRHKDGHRLPVHVDAFPLRDSMGELRGVAEILAHSRERHEVPGWTGQSQREFEIAAGLPTVAESREQLQMALRSRSASTTALLLIEMSEQASILQHGGTAMLRQATRVLGKTVAGLLPSPNFLGCWSDDRVVALIPACPVEDLEKLAAELAEVGSSCAVKWWGDRVVIRIRSVARYLDSSLPAETLIQSLEEDLKSVTIDQECSGKE